MKGVNGESTASNHRIMLTAAVAFSILLMATSIPIPAGASTTSTRSLPVPKINMAILSDPSGTYTFNNTVTGEFVINLTGYQKLLEDPYSGISGNVSIDGDMVTITVPQSTTVSTPTDTNTAWSGVGGGDCASFTAGGDGSSYCNTSSGTLGTSGVCTGGCEGTLSWYPKCWSGTSCETSYWTGLSEQNSSTDVLLQNGINVCVSGSGCGSGGSDKTMTWDMFYARISHDSNDQLIGSYPTTINSTNYEFDFAFNSGTNDTQVTFNWQVGSWSYSLTKNAYYPQTDFYQSEGVMEAPLVSNSRVVISEWSPNTVTESGWWETGHFCGCTFATGDYGTSYTNILYKLESSGGSTEAYGSLLNASYFTDTYS
jgi:hypothetical protein